ncbi:MAG TPA: excinuclease ABC subunit UvrC [Bdellovibrionota bacterium]|nr:excinuclease ABC subunit UvrC [Bdellovibrionota bacterium]
MKIQEKLSTCPTTPGVYLMKNTQGEIIYVGKAKNLKKRVKSYFNKENTPKTKALVSKIADIDFMVTATESEAFILECNLIKKYKPRYNVCLKDDKTYPYIKISLDEKWPGIYVVRRPQFDKALYFGPYSSAGSVRVILRFITKVFPIRDCTNSKFANRTRPCLSYDIGRCTAPCVDFVELPRYQEDVENLVKFLRGHVRPVFMSLKNKMNDLSQNLKYEEAASMRDRIFAIEAMMEKQNVMTHEKRDQDVIVFKLIPASAGTGSTLHVLFFFLRGGALLSKRVFHAPVSTVMLSQEKEDFMGSFLSQYYEANFIPDEILTSDSLPRGEGMKGRVKYQNLQDFLRNKVGKKIKISVPRSGEKKKLLDMAFQNLEISILEFHAKKTEKENILKLLQTKLHLKNEPLKIECFDISNISGTSAVGSQVVFKEGEAEKSEYRKYKIKTVDQINDFAMMREVLMRRLREKKDLPQLIIIDGGRGQLAIAVSVLKELGVEGVDVVGLAKKKKNKGELQAFERIYSPGRKNPIIIKPNTALEFFLSRIRDEAHRFAITYHKYVRGEALVDSILHEISLLGEKGVQALQKYFASIEDMKYASLEDLEKVPGLTSAQAKNVFEFFQQK